MPRVPKIALWNRGTARKPNYWVRYSVDGVRYQEATGTRTRQEALAFVEQLERKFRLDQWLPAAARKTEGGQITFEKYAEVVIARRIALGIATAAKDESGHVRNHLNEVFGPLQMCDANFTFQRVSEGFDQIKSKSLAGRTVRNIHTTLQAVLLAAADQGLLAHPPRPLTARRGHLPPPTDKNPEWRATAVFNREEIAQLLRCEEIEPRYRVMYATYFLTASRFAEITPLHVRDIDQTKRPLWEITIAAKKVKRHRGPAVRVVPVHRDLRAWLHWWLEEEYAVLFGNPPQPDDLLFPTLSKRRRNKGQIMCSHGEVYKRWQRHHLPAAGLRHRRLHDSRRTFISVTRSSNVNKEIVRAITHRATSDRVIDGYTTWEYDALCREISKIEWRLPVPPGQVADVVSIKGRRPR